MPTINQEAARSLAQRAIDTDKQTESNTLILAAVSLDPSIDTATIKAAWLDKWMKQNQNRKASS
jgi:hypothetical protein